MKKFPSPETLIKKSFREDTTLLRVGETNSYKKPPLEKVAGR